MLPKAAQKQIATQLNHLIDIPILGEALEQGIFEKAVNLIDRQLENFLPAEFVEIFESSEKGLTNTEADEFAERLTGYLNKIIDIPILNERQEGKLIGHFVRILTDSCRKKMSMTAPAQYAEAF